MIKVNVEELQYSAEYAEYIMDNSAGDRVICNGDMLTAAMEDSYMFEQFLATMQLPVGP
jgi:hypothetical protein